MISRQVAALSAAAVLGLFAVAGCSSSGTTANAGTTTTGSAAPAASSSPAAASNAGLTDQQLLTAFKSAAAQGTAVHVKGSMNSGGDKITLDLQLNKADKSASGTVGASGMTIPVIAVDGTVYFQMTEAVLKANGGANAAALAMVKDKWVSSKSSIGSSIGSSFAGFTSYDAFITGITSDTSGSAMDGSKPAGTTTYNGQNVAVYKGSDGSMAYFAATGPCYLLEIQSTNSTDSGSLTFTWNQPTKVTAPPAGQIFNG